MTAPDQYTVFIIHPPEPLPEAPPYVHEFYEAIGRFALTWGRLEQHVDDLERMVLNIAEDSGSPPQPMVMALKPKLRTITDSFEQCPDLSHNTKAVGQLMSEIGVLGDDRHFLVHSIFRKFVDGPPPRIVLRHVPHHKGIMTVERGEFTVDQIRVLTSEVAKLHDRLVPILRDAVDFQDPERLRRAREQDPSADGSPPPIPL